MEKPENPRLLAPDSTHRVWSDVTLRDLFAAAALCGFISAKPMHFNPQDDAEYCYKLADAMLAMRARAEAPDGE